MTDAKPDPNAKERTRLVLLLKTTEAIPELIDQLRANFPTLQIFRASEMAARIRKRLTELDADDQ